MVRIVGWFGSLLVPAPCGPPARRHFQPRRLNGLKEALTRGRMRPVRAWGPKTGFSGTTASRFLCRLPAKARSGDALDRMDRHADELVLRMNRAAEAAVPEARTLLVDAAKRMSVQDAKGILTGGDDAATGISSARLLRPLVKRSSRSSRRRCKK